MKLSLVFPIYNEEEGMDALRRAVTGWIAAQPYEVEVILVDDGSKDRSWLLLQDWSRSDPRIKSVALSRNFGHQAAVTAGLYLAQGDAVVILDADLQDPLEVIPEMVARYEEGYDVVYGKRISREGETAFKRVTAWLFYCFMCAFVDPNLPADTGDFRLVSRRCLDGLLQMHEVKRFLRGMFAWCGYRQIAVEYHRRAREHGTTKYPLRKMLLFAWDALLSFSTLPIRCISTAGFVVAVLGFLYGAYTIMATLLWHDAIRGWTSLMAVLLVIGGFILIGMGVIGEYVARIYDEVKRRPLYLVRASLNLEDGRPLQPR